MTNSKNCIFCTDTNRIIDFVPDTGDAAAAIAKFTPEYGTALVVLPIEEAHQRFENSFKSEPVEIPSCNRTPPPLSEQSCSRAILPMLVYLRGARFGVVIARE